MQKLYENLKSKITIANWLFIIPAIIHFAVVFILQYKFIGGGELVLLITSFEQIVTCVIVKIVTFCLLVIFYQFIWIVIKGFIENNSKIKQITKYFLIYFIPNLVMLFLIFPGYHTIFSLEVTEGIVSYILNFYLWLNAIPQILAYNFIPSLFGLSLFNIFIFSLILTFVVYQLKNKLNYKYAELIYIPFLLPHILVLNSYPMRIIYAAWMFILIFTIIFICYKTNKYNNSNILAFILAVLSSVIIMIRSEYIILLLLIPAMIYFLKIFNKKRFLIFLACFIMLFLTMLYIGKRCNNTYYVLHNFSLVYEKINNYTEQDKLILSNVFSGGIDIHSENNNINDANNMKKAIKILSKYTILNIPNLFKLNIDQYKHFDKDFHKKPQGEGSNDNIEEKINPINNSLKNKITNWFTSYDYSYWKIYTKYIGTPLLYYIILFLILAIGLICRNYFYVWFCVIFISIFSLLMVIVPFCDYAYVFPCFVCLQWIFMIFVLDLMKLFSIIKS